MARRRARIIPRSRGNARPTSPRGRGRPAPRGRGPQGPSRGRPTSPRGPQGTKRLVPNRQFDLRAAELKKRKRANETLMKAAEGSRGPQSGATGRPTINPGQDLRNFMDTMRRAPRGPMSGAQLSNRNRMQQQMMQAEARANMAQGGRGSLFGAMGNVQQRLIPNRDGGMANMAQMQAMGAARQRPPAISMDPRRGTFGKAFNPRPMPPSNYMRQIMPAGQMQRGMGRGPMARANIGQIQASRPTFGQQMRSTAPGQRLKRSRIIPRRR